MATPAITTKATELNWFGGPADAWIVTYSGNKFNVFNPNSSSVNIEDIAHALAMCTRFNGHLKHYYSIAEHCWHMSYLVEPQFALAALMHDAAEAYLSDIPRPIKGLLPQIKLIEGGVINTIFDHYRISMWSDTIFKFDRALCLAEAEQAGMSTQDWFEGHDIYGHVDTVIRFWDWNTAKEKFLERFNELTGGTFLDEQQQHNNNKSVLESKGPRDNWKKIPVTNGKDVGGAF